MGEDSVSGNATHRNEIAANRTDIENCKKWRKIVEQIREFLGQYYRSQKTGNLFCKITLGVIRNLRKIKTPEALIFRRFGL